jgi:hypothetical protein
MSMSRHDHAGMAMPANVSEAARARQSLARSRQLNYAVAVLRFLAVSSVSLGLRDIPPSEWAFQTALNPDGPLSSHARRFSCRSFQSGGGDVEP